MTKRKKGPSKAMFREAFKAGAVKRTRNKKGAAAANRQAIAIAFSKRRQKGR